MGKLTSQPVLVLSRPPPVGRWDSELAGPCCAAAAGPHLRRVVGPMSQDLWCTASARCGPPAAACRVRMAPFVGFLWALLLTALRGSAVPGWLGPEDPPPNTTLGHSLPRFEQTGRKHRRALTISLNARWCQQRAPPPCHLLAGLLPPARLHWSKRARRLYPRRPRWPGWPMRACRIGEAANPGPPAPGTPVGGERGSARERERSPASGRGAPSRQRLFCPVPGCLCADPTRAPGWANVATMRSHIDAHLSGSLTGDVPASWMQTHGRTRCLVCGLSVSERHGVHPTCRPEARAAAPDGAQPMDIDNLQLPSFTEIQAARTPTLRHVPVAARHTWNHILTRALAAVVHRNDERAWRELLMLPQCLLCAPTRGGRRHSKAVAAYTLDRLHRWQEGERLSLWSSRAVGRPRRTTPPSPDAKRSLATSLAREGFDRKACAALLSKGLCPESDTTAQALQALHPGARHPVPHHSMTFPLARTSPLTW